MSQSLAKIFVHIVFSTKERVRYIKPEIDTELYAYIGSIIKLSGSIPILINGSEDHVHVLLILNKTITLSKIIEDMKKSSSRWIKSKGTFYHDFTWQRGFAAFSVGNSELDRVKNYIGYQKEHHKLFNFQEELIKLLEKEKIDYNPDYLWN